MNLADIRAGIALRLDVIGGLQVNAYELPNPSPPTAWPYPSNVEYLRAMNGGVKSIELTVHVLAGSPDSRAAQIALDSYIDDEGDNSISAALLADPTLNGSVHSMIVKSCTGYKLYAVSGKVHMLGAEWELDILL